jgi:thiamine biosynthesis lipoprotein
VGVRDPDDVEGTIAELVVSDVAVATSGDYQRYFEYGSRRYHHLFDTDTGAPRVTGERSLTVEAGTCMVADAAATTAFGMADPERDGLLRNMGSVARVVHRV